MERVLQVTGGMNRAGAETMLMNAYRKIDRNKLQFDFLVYTDKKQDFEDEILELGGRVIHITGCKFYNYIIKINEVINKYGPYIAVHAHNLHNNAFIMLAAKKHKEILRISHSHNTTYGISNTLLTKFYIWITKKIIKKYSQVWCACGEEAGEYLFGKEFKKRGIVINNGIDLSEYNHRSVECEKIVQKYNLKDNLVIGAIGRLMKVKNQSFMIKIAKKLKDMDIKFKMLIVGEGVMRVELENEIDRLNLNEDVLLLGLRSDISNLLQIFDVFIMPSYFEGNPVALVEAQASGLPCVVSDTITDKMDMGLELITRCSLNDNIDYWCDKLINSKCKRINDYKIIEEAFKKNLYDSISTARILYNIYKG